MKEKVFAPFFRLEVSRNKETGGIGLGLSIARAVARQHGGDIKFISGGAGMQTVLSLPKDEAGEVVPVPRPYAWSIKKVMRLPQNGGSPGQISSRSR